MSADDLADRLDAVERAITDDDTDLTDVRTAATLTDEVERLEQRVAELEATVEELDAAVEAVRGYAGNVRAVNRDVERRASAALAKVEALESAVDPETMPEGSVAQQSADDGVLRGSSDGAASDSAGPTTRKAGPSTSDPRDAATGQSRPNSRPDERRETRDHDSAPVRQSGVATRSTGTSTGDSQDVARRMTDTGRDEDGAEDASGTEQFIERVRDAL